MRLPRLAATFALTCASLACATVPLAAGQSTPSGSSSASQPASHKKKHHSKRQPTQKAPTADRISEIQSALARQGYYEGDPSGKMDSKTVAAMEKFQSANGLDSTGKLDAPTLQKLGLGSDIAGVSAPKPATPPSCCSMMAPASAGSTQSASTASAPAATVAANTPSAADPPKPADH